MVNMQLFMDKIQLPAEGQAELKKLKELLSRTGTEKEIDVIARDFFADKTQPAYDTSLTKIRELADRIGAAAYSVEFFYMMTCGELLLEEYRAQGLSEALFWDTMYDLHCKFDECRNVHHIWGTFVSFWYYGFWTKTIFKLGRLEYEITSLEIEQYEKNSFHLAKGDRVYSIHIPSEGPLRKNDVLDSLKKAHAFFGYQKGEIAPFICLSWLLYPDNVHIFPQGSNLKEFFDLFDIVQGEKDAGFADCWRVFGQDLNGAPADLPCRTTLQKNIIKWLTAGGSMGEGIGMLLFDGENIL